MLEFLPLFEDLTSYHAEAPNIFDKAFQKGWKFSLCKKKKKKKLWVTGLNTPRFLFIFSWKLSALEKLKTSLERVGRSCWNYVWCLKLIDNFRKINGHEFQQQKMVQFIINDITYHWIPGSVDYVDDYKSYSDASFADCSILILTLSYDVAS